ncbi:MAG: hypothetical protein ACO29Q_09865 [Crocinitomicaceae bacterium]|jgi:hypothetical protein
MNWTGFWTIFFLATFKFSVSTIPGPHLGMSFFETAIAAFSGAAVCAFICYFASDVILNFLKKRAEKKHQDIIASGQIPKQKKKFTRMNRILVRIKIKFGQVGICFFAPFFLSVPLGSMVVAKFYGKRWETYPLIVLGLAVNSSLTSILVYFVFN